MVGHVTPVASPTCSVSAAMTPSTVQTKGECPWLSSQGWKWSLISTKSKPGPLGPHRLPHELAGTECLGRELGPDPHPCPQVRTSAVGQPVPNAAHRKRERFSGERQVSGTLRHQLVAAGNLGDEALGRNRSGGVVAARVGILLSVVRQGQSRDG